jgi:hypothetical protein
MKFEQQFLTLYRQLLRHHRPISVRDLAAICVMASEPDRSFTAAEIAAGLEVPYHTAWSSLRRLLLDGLAMDGRLSERGLEVFAEINGDPHPREKAVRKSPHDLY